MAERDFRRHGPIAVAYRRALREARRLGFAHSAASVTELRAVFRDAIERLGKDASDTAITLERAGAMRAELREMLRLLETGVTRTTARQVGLTLRDVMEVHRHALKTIAERYNPAALTAVTHGLTALARFDTIPIRAVAAITARTGRGLGAATFRTLVHRHVAEAAPVLDRMIGSAVARGVSPSRLTRDVAALLAGNDPELLAAARSARRGATAATLAEYGVGEAELSSVRTLWYDARRIAVSEPLNAYREATAMAGVESPVIAAYKWQLSGRHDAIGLWDECDELATVDAYDLGAGFFPPEQWPVAPHPFCVPGETIVQGSVQAGMRLHYRGDVITLRTRDGHDLTVTPNHPVLTPRGLVAARQLREGDDLLAYKEQVQTPFLSRVSNEHNAPARIDEVVDFLRQVGGCLRRDRQAHYLYGEGACGNGKIDIVSANRLYGLDAETASDEVLAEEALDRSTIPLSRFDGAGLPFEALQRVSLAATAGMGSFDLMDGAVGIALENTPVEATRFGQAADLDTPLPEAAEQSRSAYARFLREMVERHAGAIAVDEIIEIGHRNYDGHVYDLQTETGVIVANGLLIRNCACTQGEVLFRDPEDWDKPKERIALQRIVHGEGPEGIAPAALARVRQQTAAIIRRAA